MYHFYTQGDTPMLAKDHKDISDSISKVHSNIPAVEIKGFNLAGKGIARVVARVIHTSESKVNHALVLKAIGEKFQGKMEAVASSFTSVSKGPVDELITGVVSVVRDIVALDGDTAPKGFKSYSSNMFMDEEDQLWAVSQSDQGKLLIRTTGIDDDESLLNLLSSVSSNIVNTRETQHMQSISSAVASQVAGGDYVSYVNANNQLALGYVIATTDTEQAVILQPEAAEPEIVSVAAIVDIMDVSEAKQPELDDSQKVNLSMSAARGDVNVAMLLDYYKLMFQADPSYYKEIEKRVKSRVWA